MSEQGGSAIDGAVHEGASVDANGNAQAVEPGGQFGWHMWTQALIGGKWYDFDATLHDHFTVGHVLVGTSSMSDKEAHNNHMQMAALIGAPRGGRRGGWRTHSYAPSAAWVVRAGWGSAGHCRDRVWRR